jgi:biopolymer transport protein ExbB
MRKLLLILGMFVCVSLIGTQVTLAQAEETVEAVEETAEVADSTADAAAESAAEVAEAAVEETSSTTEAVAGPGAFQVLKEKFIEGGWQFMAVVLLCLILGLAFSIERIITLNIASANTDTLISRIEDKLASGDMEGAKNVAKATPGPAASVLYEGLRNADGGPEAVEKAIVSYGSVQMGLLEKGLVWISLFIALAPMLGFMGTVIGMIGAFDKIQAAGDISPSIVAGGIKVALLTTVFGWIVAIILQIFYNYIVSKIDGITNRMEDASISLVEVMARNKVFK